MLPTRAPVAFQFFFLLFENFVFYTFITLIYTEGSCLFFLSSTLQFPTEELRRVDIFVVANIFFLDFIVYRHQYSLSHLHNAMYVVLSTANYTRMAYTY